MVSDRVKELVTFEKHDIIRDEQFSGYDLILCRNLFIYIDKDYADEVFKHITDALNSGGYLIIGKAETVPRARLEDFDVQSTQRRVYRRK